MKKLTLILNDRLHAQLVASAREEHRSLQMQLLVLVEEYVVKRQEQHAKKEKR